MFESHTVNTIKLHKKIDKDDSYIIFDLLSSANFLLGDTLWKERRDLGHKKVSHGKF